MDLIGAILCIILMILVVIWMQYFGYKVYLPCITMEDILDINDYIIEMTRP